MSNLGYREIANLGPLGIKQLNDTLRALWAKVMGNIELRDLDREVKSTIAGKADSGEVETLSTLVRQTAGELALKASLTAVDELGDRVAGAETALTLKADQAALTSAVGGLQSQLNLVPGQITAAVESIDELHAGTSVTITPAEGLVVDQYLPGNGGVPFQTRIAADRFGVYRAPDGAAIMAAGADADGTGYVAVNRLRDPQVDNGMYVRVYNRAAGDGSFWGGVGLELVRIREGAHEVMGQWGYLADAEAATAMHLRRRGALLELGAGGANGVRQVSTDIDAQPMANQEADEVVIESLTGVEGGVLPGYSAAGALDGYQLQLHVRRYVDGEWIYSQDGRWPRLLMRNRERDAGGNPGGVPNIMLGVGSGSNLARILMAPTADGNSGRITLTGMTVPAASSSYDLGTSSQRWRYIYLNNSPSVSSDERHKRGICALPYALALILALQPIEYVQEGESDDAPPHMGFGARQVDKALEALGLGPRAVVDRSDPEHLALLYGELIAPLVGAVQAQQRRIDGLEARLEALGARTGKGEG